jgi:hypothetical protein
MSAAGRRRIAEAQRRRWTKARKEDEASETPTKAAPKKRRISAAARARIAAATKKRWKAWREEKAGAAKKAPAVKRAAVKKAAPAAKKAAVRRPAEKKGAQVAAVQPEASGKSE